MTNSLAKEMEAYERERESLEVAHYREWVVFHSEKLAGTYPSFDEAAVDAVRRFGRGPYLIRQVAAPVRRVPALLQFGTKNALG